MLTKIDEILAWEQQREAERDTRFVELGRYLCEVRARQYWRVENVKSFDEFLERRFPESRRKAYYLMSIHEHLAPQARKDLKQVGWTKGVELAKLAKRDRQHFDCAIWLHKAREMPKEEFKQVVENELTGRETEPWEIVYFKLYQSPLQAIIAPAKFPANRENYREFAISWACPTSHFCSSKLHILLQTLRQKVRIEQGNSRATSGSSFPDGIPEQGMYLDLDAAEGIRTVFAIRPSSRARSCSLSQSSGRLAVAGPESLRQYPAQGMHPRRLLLRNAL